MMTRRNKDFVVLMAVLVLLSICIFSFLPRNKGSYECSSGYVDSNGPKECMLIQEQADDKNYYRNLR